jgi:hypothetical protein
MATTLALLESPPLVRHTTWSVLRAAGAIAFFVAWGVLIYHAGLWIQAERKLTRMLEEANEFANLPRVGQRELHAVASDTLERAGWPSGQVALVRVDTTGGPAWRVAALQVAASDVLPQWCSRAGLVDDRQLTILMPNHPHADAKKWLPWGS